MYKVVVLIALATACCMSPSLVYGQRYVVSKGTITFTSDAELELIKASSAKVQGLLDPSTNNFAFTLEITSFQGFNSSLQRDHFNEKYLESHKYPRAKFSGKIIEQIDFDTPATYEVRAKGDLEIHGQKQTRIIRARITVSSTGLVVDADFIVPLSDHSITVPSIVSQKIATEIMVAVKLDMLPE